MSAPSMEEKGGGRRKNQEDGDDVDDEDEDKEEDNVERERERQIQRQTDRQTESGGRGTRGDPELGLHSISSKRCAIRTPSSDWLIGFDALSPRLDAPTPVGSLPP